MSPRKAPPPLAPSAPPPAPRAHPQVALLARAPPAPPSRPPRSFAEAAAAPPSAPPLPKLAWLRKACTKQGTKANTALLRPSAGGPPSNAAAILNFVASKPLGERLPISQMVTLHGDWSLTFAEALTLPDLKQLQAALDSFHHPGTEVVNHPTSASLKFPHVPTIHPDGSVVSDSDLLAAVHSHPRWCDASFVTPPRFIQPAARPGDLSALVFCEVHDSRTSSTARSLLKSTPGSLTGLPPFAPPAAGGVT
ncbi:hypothetical protein AX15_007424 [Amanita polypyramis BW_CC]|nr:hypothetical protein AX15_007424 [Amanita polypyramis BW_CC]